MAINPFVPTLPASQTVPEATPILAFEAKTDIASDNQLRSFVSPDIRQDHSSVNIHDEQRTIKKKKKKKKYAQKEESGGGEGTTSASTTERRLFVQLCDPNLRLDSGVCLSNELSALQLRVPDSGICLSDEVSEALHVSNQLMDDSLTHNPRPPVTMTGQSSLIPSLFPGYIPERGYGQSSNPNCQYGPVAYTTAPASCLVTAPMSRSLPSCTSKEDLLLDRSDVYCMPAHGSELPCTAGSVSGRSGIVSLNEEYHMFATCSSGGQSHHPTPQTVIVNEFSPPSLKPLLNAESGTILLVDFAAGAEASPKIEEAP